MNGPPRLLVIGAALGIALISGLLAVFLSNHRRSALAVAGTAFGIALITAGA